MLNITELNLIVILIVIFENEIDSGDLFYEYDCPPTPSLIPTPSYPTSAVNGIDNGLSEINILQGVFGADCNENMIAN